MKSLIISALLFTQIAHAHIDYPVAKKIPQVETRFGTLIEDPYKWMENPSDPDLWGWIEEQKKVTNNYLEANLLDAFATRTLEYRKLRAEQAKVTEAAEPIIARPLAPLFEEDMGNGKRFIQWKTTKNNNFKSNEPKTESATYAIKAQTVASGDLQRVIITQKSDNKLVDVLMVKFYTFITWADDNSFYYITDMDQNIGGGKPALLKHTVGEIQSEDQLLLTGRSGSSELTVHQVGKNFYAQVDEVIGSLQLSTGKLTNRHLVDGEIVEMQGDVEAEATILSFKNANRGEFHKLRLRDGSRRVFVKEQDFVLNGTKTLDIGNTLVLGLKDGSNVAGIYNSLSATLTMIDLQDGTIDYVSHSENVLKLGFETYVQPRKVYSYDLKTKELKVLAAQSLPIEVDAEKVYYTASNGELASMWVMKKKGVKLTDKTPTILYGYGGFKVSVTPAFGMYESLSWMEKGGSFVVVTLPGSLDYGYSWFEIAKVGGRIHAWDSFALAAKELFKRGWTSNEHIGMMGASNGGTLTAGTLQRHSDTFKAAIPIVGVMDLLNFPLFTAGKYWTEDYGNPFTEKDFHAMFPLSPYHNIEKRSYPATMVMTAEFDDRVVPMHSYKYLARLQEYNTGSAPILLYNKEWGAHGRASGSSRESSKYVAAFYTFFAQQLGL